MKEFSLGDFFTKILLYVPLISLWGVVLYALLLTAALFIPIMAIVYMYVKGYTISSGMINILFILSVAWFYFVMIMSWANNSYTYYKNNNIGLIKNIVAAVVGVLNIISLLIAPFLIIYILSGTLLNTLNGYTSTMLIWHIIVGYAVFLFWFLIFDVESRTFKEQFSVYINLFRLI